MPAGGEKMARRKDSARMWATDRAPYRGTVAGGRTDRDAPAFAAEAFAAVRFGPSTELR
jgi:hypothetical protein